MRKLVLVLLLLTLAGCALSPGMKRSDENLSDLELPLMKDGKLTTGKVKVTPVTAQLIVERESATKQAIQIPKPESASDSYRIGPRDRLLITVWEHPELNDPGAEKIQPEQAGKVVQDDGTVYYPYIGNIPVGGKTVPEARELLTSELSKYFKKVKLDVRVIAYLAHRVYVVGEVKNPGIQSMVDTPLTVGEAISRAGGSTLEADLSHVTLSREGKTYPLDLLALYEQGHGGEDVYLKDGDVLNLPDRRQNRVFMMGEVQKQQALQINKGRMTLAEALSDASGVNFDTSNPEDIYVIRAAQATPEIFHLNSDSPDAMVLADRFALQPHDVVYVGTAGVTRWSRAMNQLIPSTLGQFMTRGAFYGM
ncbi:polysaccharide biosynthesis/export family protein [Methylococcus sp. EFPC2]|nr:polysaccharide biosynthesis/export family protein [Methylococcus sp. EFPC2]